MAVTLTAAIGPNDAWIPVSGNVPAPYVVPFLQLIDSEVVSVIQGGATYWQILRSQLGTYPAGHASGAILQPFSQTPTFPTGSPYIAETLPREQIPETATVIGTTGQIALQAVWLSAGQLVSNITVCTSATAAGTPLHFAIGLVDQYGNLCCSSVDQLATAMAAQTAFTFAMSTPYRVAISGLYYVAIGSVATTVPTIKGVARVNGVLAGTAPPLCGVSGTTYATGALPSVCTIMAAAAVTTSWWAGLS
jgi:hypothetical protein